MRLLFTRSKAPLSVFIRLGTGQPSSHFAIVFNDELVFQSNLLGTNITSLERFLKHATIVHEIRVPITEDVEDRVYKNIMPEYAGRGYDYGAFFFDMYRTFVRRIFGKTINKNLWSDGDRLLCVGLAKCLDQEGMPSWVRESVRVVPDFDVYFPEDLYTYLESARANADSLGRT